MEKSKENCCKIIIIGNSNVGKSCILNRFIDDEYKKLDCTLGIDFRVKKLMVDKETVSLQIWDTAGQEKYATYTNCVYRGADAIIVVYSVDNMESFACLDSWFETIENLVPELSKSCLCLVGSKADLDGVPVIKYEEGLKYANKKGINFFQCSALKNYNINTIFTTLARDAISDKRRRALEDRFSKEDKKKPIVLKEEKKKEFSYCC